MSSDARQAILGSIRSHLAASVPHDTTERSHRGAAVAHTEPGAVAPVRSQTPVSLVELFKQNLDAVGGHCIIAGGDTGIAQALTQIISDLQKTNLRAQRIAISDQPSVEHLLHQTDLEIEALAIAPNASDIFTFDLGITSAQAAIAETGTLVLDTADERHRLVSLVPKVHIAIIDAVRICETLGEALTLLRKERELSRNVTFITGPSRTADIELTLTIGVHGPQELYVIVNNERHLGVRPDAALVSIENDR
jgi:L-lactate dehydrogenase complex protein LldG